MRKLTALLACLMCTCSNAPIEGPMDADTSGSSPTLKSGSRLHNKYVSATDGTVALGGGLYDTLVAADCTFVQAEDSMMRCLPTGAFVQTSYFLDATCTQSFAYSSKCQPALKYAVDYLSATCGQQNRVYNLTEVATPPTQVYFRSGVSCTAVANPFTVYRMYSYGTTVAPNTFVMGTVMN